MHPVDQEIPASLPALARASKVQRRAAGYGFDWRSTETALEKVREELERDPDPWRAAARTRATAGRTTLFAGTTLIVALVFSAFLQPGSLLLSLATATGVVTTISVAISNLAVPRFTRQEGLRSGRLGCLRVRLRASDG